MKPRVLFLNLPNLQYINGEFYSGTAAGSCWPFTVKGTTPLTPFPFFLSWATGYLRQNGFDAHLLDAVASRHYSYQTTQKAVADWKPDILVIETEVHLAERALAFAEWAKPNVGCKIVMTGPHMAQYADEILASKPFVDHTVIGEFDLACLKIANGSEQKKFTFDHVTDIDRIGCQLWHPYRDPDVLANYLDPSMYSERIQLQVNGSRGCQYRCTFCAWPQIMYKTHRMRAAATILNEIRTVAAMHPVKSIFFDDETWNSGPRERLAELCAGLKEIGIPWSYMGRIDTASHQQFEMFVESGCVGMRFGMETLHQRLLDAVNKKLDAKKSWENINWLLTRFHGLHFRLLTMRMLPGETQEEEASDADKFQQLVALGASNGNRVDLQTAECVAMPGTILWKQQQEQGIQRDNLEAHPDHPSALAQRLAVYQAKES